MCGCKQGTCPGNCPCGCRHTPPPTKLEVTRSRLRRVRRWLAHKANRYLGTLMPAKVVYLSQEELDGDGDYYFGLVPCWCDGAHASDFWHDPTHGQVDRDIQDKVTERYGNDLPLAQRAAIESTLQGRRDQGLSL